MSRPAAPRYTEPRAPIDLTAAPAPAEPAYVTVRCRSCGAPGRTADGTGTCEYCGAPL